VGGSHVVNFYDVDQFLAVGKKSRPSPSNGGGDAAPRLNIRSVPALRADGGAPNNWLVAAQ
jgi:hypothetical protein